MRKELMAICTIFALVCGNGKKANGQGVAPAQTTKANDIMITVTGGLSQPFGNFTKTDFSDPTSGFAGTGYNAGISGVWMLSPHFGISAMVSYQRFAFKGLQTLADSFKEAFAID